MEAKTTRGNPGVLSEKAATRLQPSLNASDNLEASCSPRVCSDGGVVAGSSFSLSVEVAAPFGPLDFRRELFRTARSFQKVTHDAIGPVCKDHGVTVQQMHVLLELVQEPGQTASRLSERAGILHTNFATVCRKLEERGLVERHRSDVDRRSFELQVTDAGRALLKRIDEDIEQRYGDLFEAEPCETFDTIVQGFRAMRELVEKFGR